MASKKNNLGKSVKENIKDMAISSVLTENYMPYAMSVIVSRAIPEIDGFKPAHRKLLYTMYKMGLLKGSRTKSANIVGQTMKLNPHGDQAIYETMVRLTKSNESLLCPLVDSKGNFGKHYSRDMAYAASRYTEAKLMPVCTEFFQELDKNAVDMVDNYDGTLKEPSLLPVPFPSILTNPTMGIAVSIASNICSFNLEEVCRATILRIKKPKADVLQEIKAPDFSTGGIVVFDADEMRKIADTGRGSVRIRGKYRLDTKKNIIEVYEIPYSTTAENIIEDIISLAKNGTEPAISAVRDETDLNGLKIAIEYKKGTDPDALMQRLYKSTKLEDTFSCNFNVLVDGVPDVRGITEIIDSWIKWRTQCVNRTVKFDLTKAEKKLILLQALEKIALNINKVIKIIKESTNDNEVISNLMSGFKINEEQAEYVAEIKLRNLNKEYILTRTKEIDSLISSIAKLKETADNEKKLHSIIVKQLDDIVKKYGEPRKSDVINKNDINDESSVIDDIPDIQIKIARTSRGYIKKVSVSVPLSDIRTLDDDTVVQSIDTSNRSDLLFFSSNQNVYKLKVSALKNAKPSDTGEYLSNLLEMASGETIIGMAATKDYSGSVILAFADGKMVRLPMKVYETKQNRKKLVNAISSASKLIGICQENEFTDYVCETNLARGLTLNSQLIPERTTKNSNGVQIVRLGKGEEILTLTPSYKYSAKVPPKAQKAPAAPKKI